MSETEDRCARQATEIVTVAVANSLDESIDEADPFSNDPEDGSSGTDLRMAISTALVVDTYTG